MSRMPILFAAHLVPTRFFLNTRTHTRTPLPSVLSHSSLRVTALVLLFYCCFAEECTHARAHTHKTTFVQIILSIEFRRLNRAVTSLYGDSTPRAGKPCGQFFGGCIKNWMVIQQAHLEVLSMSGSAPKMGLKFILYFTKYHTYKISQHSDLEYFSCVTLEIFDKHFFPSVCSTAWGVISPVPHANTILSSLSANALVL